MQTRSFWKQVVSSTGRFDIYPDDWRDVHPASDRAWLAYLAALKSARLGTSPADEPNGDDR